MRELTLTLAERRAIDWVGHRYVHGDSFSRWLDQCQRKPEEAEWGEEDNITFVVPSELCYEMQDKLPEDGFACFAPDFSSKLMAFLSSIT